MKKIIASILVLIVFGMQSAVFAKPVKRIYFKKGKIHKIKILVKYEYLPVIPK